MKRKLSLISVLVLLLLFTSCSQERKEEINTESDEYQQQISIFTDIWSASPLPQGLNLGDSWDTDSFSMKFSESEYGININFEANDYTISECFEDGRVFMNAIAYTNGPDSYLFDAELFYMMALIEYVDENSASITIHKPSDADAIMLIVIVDGVVYNEMVFLS